MTSFLQYSNGDMPTSASRICSLVCCTLYPTAQVLLKRAYYLSHLLPTAQALVSNGIFCSDSRQVVLGDNESIELSDLENCTRVWKAHNLKAIKDVGQNDLV